jgi:cytochrome b
MSKVRVWDVPTRLIHWLIVLLVGTLWWTAETGRMDWHRYCGYTLLGLVSFRIYWGFAGASTARFSQFLRGPRAVWGYLRGRWETLPGHNPIGALSAVLLLALLLAQIVFGLFAVDTDGIESGPLSTHVSFETGRVFARLHHQLFSVLQILIALHIVAVLFYVFVKKQNLISAMFHGKREYAQDLPPVVGASKRRLILGAIIIAALTWYITRG